MEFGIITAIALDARSNLYVADGLANSIRVFDHKGRFLRQLGRAGDGPGEFRAPVVMRITPGDTLHIFDTRLWRATIFSPSGELVRTNSLERTPEFGQIPEVRIDFEGRIFHLSFHEFAAKALSALGDDRAGIVRGLTSIVVWNDSEQDWRSLLVVPGPEIYLDKDAGVTDAPFGRRPLWAVAKRSFWYADSGEYEVIRFSAEGDSLCQISVEYPTSRVNAQERRAYYEARDVARRQPELVERVKRTRRDIPVPEFKPAVQKLVVSEEGNLWVQPVRSEDTKLADSSVWHILGNEGAFLATVEVPEGFEPLLVRGEHIYGVYRDEEEVNYVSIYRI